MFQLLLRETEPRRMKAFLDRFFQQVVAAYVCDTTAARLGSIHRLIRLAQQARQRIGVVGVKGETDAGCAMQRFVANNVGLFQTLGEAHRQLVGYACAHVRHQRHKLIATGAADDIVRPQALL